MLVFFGSVSVASLVKGKVRDVDRSDDPQWAIVPWRRTDPHPNGFGSALWRSQVYGEGEDSIF